MIKALLDNGFNERLENCKGSSTEMGVVYGQLGDEMRAAYGDKFTHQVVRRLVGAI